MNTLLRFWCNVNSWCVYKWFRPKIRFCLFFLDRRYEFKISHRIAVGITTMMLNVLLVILPKKKRSEYWWTYQLGRTKEEWQLWYNRNKQRIW